MKWLEIIELRAVNGTHKDYESGLKSIINEFHNKTDKYHISVYNRLDLSSDISVHIFHQTGKPDFDGSPEGLQLKSSLRVFGLTNHSIWIEKAKDKI